jgi:hypothetical protein
MHKDSYRGEDSTRELINSTVGPSHHFSSERDYKLTWNLECEKIAQEFTNEGLSNTASTVLGYKRLI